MSLEFVVEKNKQLAFDHPKPSEINKLIADIIAVDDQHFSIVGDIGFTRLLNCLELRYHLPSRRYFSETLILEKVKLAVAQLISEQQYVSCTTDIWLSLPHDLLLSLYHS